MHLVSGDRQMNTEMNRLRKLELVGSNAILCVSERDMLWTISKSGFFKLDQDPIFPSHLAITKAK